MSEHIHDHMDSTINPHAGHTTSMDHSGHDHSGHQMMVSIRIVFNKIFKNKLNF